MKTRILKKDRAKAFSKKILGKKNETRMICHRISVKFYDNGIVIKPIGKQGIGIGNKWEGQIINQEAMFLTNENAEHLFIFLKTWDDKNKIVKVLEQDNAKLEQESKCDEFGRSARYS